MRSTTNASLARSAAAISTRRRKRFAIPALLAAVLALIALALPAAASADPLGSFTSFSTEGPNPLGIASGPDGNLWFPGSGPSINRMTTAGVVTQFTEGFINEGSSLAKGGITAGPDGNLWFTDATFSGTPAIGRITPSGTVTEFTEGLAVEALPGGITAGPDGNLWFTDGTFGGTPAIGRITPSGTITEFSSGLSAESRPTSITAGADGNLWFTIQGETMAIGKITPSGTITEYSAGLNAGSNPGGPFTAYGITTGPDGNVWFTDWGTTKAIGKITPSGTITEYSAGLNAGSTPRAITAAPDGNLWFTDGGSTKAVGRVTTSGTITEFSEGLTEASSLSAITAGSDGNLWMPDGFHKLIWKMGIEPQPVLTVNHEGTGEGTVQSNPAGIEACGGTCEAEFAKETPVTLTASPAVNSAFTSWKGCGEVEGRKCKVTMSEAKTVKAKFSSTYAVTVKKTAGNTGLGSVSGVSCAASCTEATASFLVGKTVTLTPKASKGSDFTEWSSCPGGEIVEVTKCKMSAAGTAEAKFTATPQFNLTVTKKGGGQGTVKSTPASINCGATCSTATSAFYKGTEVELTASVVALKGSEFGGWSEGAGTCAGLTNPCKMPAILANQSVKAEFK